VYWPYAYPEKTGGWLAEQHTSSTSAVARGYQALRVPGPQRGLVRQAGATLGLRAAAGEPKAQLAREFNISRQTLYQHFRTNE